MIKPTKTNALIIFIVLGILQSSFSITFHISGAFADQWDFIPILEKYYTNDDWLSHIFGRHGDHFHTSAYLIMVFFASLSNWNIVWEIYAIVFFNISSFLILYRITIQHLFNQSNTLTFLSSIIIGLVFFSLVHSINLIWGWQLVVHITIFGVLLTTWAFSRQKITPILFLVAVFGGLFSSFAFSCGFGVWPMGLVLIILHLNISRQHKIIYSICWSIVAIITLSYFFSVTGGHFSQDLVFNPLKIFIFMMYTFGMSVSFFSLDFSLIVSIIAFTVLLYVSIINFTKITDTQQKQLFNISIGLLIFAFAAIFLISLGRAEFGYAQTRSTRYIIFSQFFWIGTILQIWIYMAHKEVISIKLEKYTKNIFFFLIVATMVSSFRGGDDAYDLHSEYNEQVLRPFLEASPEQQNQVLFDSSLKYFPHYPPHPTLKKHLTFLKKHNLNIYREQSK